MTKYRKKPVTVEAFQWNGGISGFSEPLHPEWFNNAIKGGTVRFDVDDKGPHWIIRTLEGDHRANPHDWIIQGVKGELYPCKSDIFELTYEVAEQPAQDTEQSQ